MHSPQEAKDDMAGRATYVADFDCGTTATSNRDLLGIELTSNAADRSRERLFTEVCPSGVWTGVSFWREPSMFRYKQWLHCKYFLWYTYPSAYKLALAAAALYAVFVLLKSQGIKYDCTIV